jgi:hypothetical protein
VIAVRLVDVLTRDVSQAAITNGSKVRSVCLRLPVFVVVVVAKDSVECALVPACIPQRAGIVSSAWLHHICSNGHWLL